MQNSGSSARRSWLVALSALLVFAAAACGGDDTGEDAADDGGAGAAVAIDGVTYEASEEQSCTALGGGLGAAFTNPEMTLTITVSLLPEDDPERSSVRVDDESDPDDILQWESGGATIESNPGLNAVANVREHTVDGRSGSGSAVFIDTTKMTTGTAEPTDGTFEVQCADI